MLVFSIFPKMCHEVMYASASAAIVKVLF